ncbi:ImmA/IrrE family metallo-endopeptidase [Plantactinospora solaniradicis]|uniref:ImmA/IrrE family metallo-endopeptidase n=1 Tax=Plantactinospora solaniradicis TaxID=1723736 RepID=A0ABW1KM04_9ACTN
MSQVEGLPEWAERLREALAVKVESVDQLYGKLGLPASGGWLADALAGQVEPRRQQLAQLAVFSGIPLAVLVGDVPVRNLAVALRSSVDVSIDEVSAASRRAEDALADLGLLLSWYPQEAARTSAAAARARRAVARDPYEKHAAIRTAEGFRDLLGIEDEEPVGDLAELLESLGAAVVFEPMPKAIQGITVRDTSRDAWQAVVVVNSDTWWGRQRYTLAHELGHLLYRDDQSLFINQKSYDEQDLVEYRAEIFARHFLAPDAAVREFWSEHGPRRAVDGLGVPLAKFMMHFGLSRQASVRTLVEVVGVPRDRLVPYTFPGCSIEQIMRQARLGAEWDQQRMSQHQPSASNWMLSMVLDAYRQRLVGVRVVARVLGRPNEVLAVEQELQEQGYGAGGGSLQSQG